MSHTELLDSYQLDDRYLRDTGRVFLTGTQALVRLPLMQRALDRQAGLNTAGFISGYRGSPLGGYDQALWQARDLLDRNQIRFQPGVNEDLAASAIMGTQQIENDPHRTVDGVFAIWYGKGPGIDRSGDALRHGNAMGSSPHGGVLVVAGDDHGAVSSSFPHQSDVAFMAWMMPTLNPATIAEYLSYGLYGIALSRFSGTWVGFKAISESVESGVSLVLPPPPQFRIPADFTPPPGGLHQKLPELPGTYVEERLQAKIAAVRAFAHANPLDYTVFGLRDARFGMVTTGKGHLDAMEALRLLGIDESKAREIGIDVYKVGMVWPLDVAGIKRFLAGKEEFLVVEEKRGIIESELKESFYDYSGNKPHYMVGKFDETGQPLVPWTGELSPTLLAPIIAQRIQRVFPHLDFTRQLAALREARVESKPIIGVSRTPYFCSGCPHSSSTHVPDGSEAQTGIGCHVMAAWMDRNTTGTLFQMGAEGVNWVGRSPFNGNRHIFQNMGEGTYFHSGLMAIRQAVAAKINITYKILYNDAVAMTGGQPVDGQLSVPMIAQQVRAEGVQRIALVARYPDTYIGDGSLPTGTTLHAREEIDAVQRELREVPGTSVLIYEQTCATELRRRRKRGKAEVPAERVFINELVCEGCGDCAVQSNCLSVVPVDTPFGRKKRIDQSTCNVDLSCLKGNCPSLVTVTGVQLRRPESAGLSEAVRARIEALPAPDVQLHAQTHDLLVTGVGGTGVVTVGALITMAAHLEGKGASVLDFMGFAQKGGAVLGYVRLGRTPADLHQSRIDSGMADSWIACDLVVATSPKAMATLKRNTTRIAASTSMIQTGDFLRHPDADIGNTERLTTLARAVGEGNLTELDASTYALKLMGDTVFANIMTLGFAWQQGLVPVSREALARAIELNGVAIKANQAAFQWGRLLAVDPDFVHVQAGTTPQPAETLEHAINRRRDYLAEYQDAELAERYAQAIQTIRAREASVAVNDLAVTEMTVKLYFRLLAHKDAYEVARLFVSPGFAESVNASFSGTPRINYHLAPGALFGRPGSRLTKRRYGAWFRLPLRILASLRPLRGTWIDPFRHTPEAATQRELLAQFETLLAFASNQMTAANRAGILEQISVFAGVRGFGSIRESAAREALKRLEMLRKSASAAKVAPAPGPKAQATSS